jgi:hypothetical protein
MKKSNLSLAVLFMVLASCSQLDFDADISTPVLSQSASTSTYHVGMEDVKTLLNVWAKSNPNKSSYTIVPVVYANDTLLYVVNYGEDYGWTLISGDKRTPSVLACDQTGSFLLNKLDQGVAVWLDDLADRIYALKTTKDTISTGPDLALWANLEKLQLHQSGLRSSKIISPDEIDSEDGYWELIDVTSTALTPITIGPLLSTKWGQTSPWNTCVPYNKAYTSRCVTGCVSVSGAQMMYFFHSKFGVPVYSYSSGSCSGYSASSSDYNYGFSFSNPSATVWDDMDLRRVMNYSTGTYNITTGTHYAAILMGFVGYAIGMNYTESASSANTEDLGSLFSDNGISSSYGDYNSSTAKSSITNGIPVIVRADATRTNHKFLGIHLYYTYSDGHSWVIDGHETQRTLYTYTYEWYETGSDDELISIGTTKTETSTSYSYYFLMNWGSNGSWDSSRFTYTGSWTADTYNFQYNRKMLYGFSVD